MLAGSDSWVTAGFDQLSANPALTWRSVSTHVDLQPASTVDVCAWADTTLSVSGVSSFAVSGVNHATGAAADLVVAVARDKGRRLNVHFACLDGRLHSAQFDGIMSDSEDEPAKKGVRLQLDVTWTRG